MRLEPPTNNSSHVKSCTVIKVGMCRFTSMSSLTNGFADYMFSDAEINDRKI